MRRRVGAYGICRDARGRVLLTRGSSRSAFPGVWSLPGGGVEQGEHPDRTVVREFAEETGLRVVTATLHAAISDVVLLPDADPPGSGRSGAGRSGAGRPEHNDRLIYDVRVAAGTPRAEAVGTTDLVDWVDPDALAERPLLPFTARVLGLDTAVPAPAVVPAGADDGLRAVQAEPDTVRPGPPTPVQRFGAYALATDPAGRVLLTRIADRYPGGGRWHLPGGGTDPGEQPDEALARELFEETGQRGRAVGLLGVSHRYDPAAVGPEGVPIDWHVVRVLYRVLVDAPGPAVVTEGAGGSTAAAGWFSQVETQTMALTEVARSVLRRLVTESAHK